MPRKSPYEHGVESHVRDGKSVRDYRRGRGDRPNTARKSRAVGNVNPEGPFNVTVFYVGESREKFIVGAESYGKALGAGIEMREKSLPPKQIRMRKVR